MGRVRTLDGEATSVSELPIRRAIRKGFETLTHDFRYG